MCLVICLPSHLIKGIFIIPKVSEYGKITLKLTIAGGTRNAKKKVLIISHCYNNYNKLFSTDEKLTESTETSENKPTVLNGTLSST